MLLALVVIVLAMAWIGHACIWTAILNYVYGSPVPKEILKPWRYATGFLILAFPLLVWPLSRELFQEPARLEEALRSTPFVLAYFASCLVFGGIILPTITIRRLLRKPPSCVVAEATRTLDVWPELGEKLIGDGKLAAATRLPGNCVFRVDFTDVTLAPPGLPPEWDGLSILVVNDLHFHGTPSRPFFERVVGELAAWGVPDLVFLLGDFVDTETHHEWIAPLLAPIRATEGGYAILGNHDRNYDPDRVRAALAALGFTVLGNCWREATIRGVRCVIAGHEGPWFAPPPDLSTAPAGLYRLCLSHTPDNFYWGIDNRIGLMLSGHTHGGAIRIPVIGSIFVPSIFGRRFDMGVFEQNGTVLVVNRGLSGREPIRFRCNPEVVRITLKARRG